MDTGKVCVSAPYFYLLFIIVCFSIMWLFINFHQLFDNKSDNKSDRKDTVLPIIIKDSVHDKVAEQNLNDDLMIGELPPASRDYRKLYDPLKGPTRRYIGYPNYYGSGGPFNSMTKGYFPGYQLMGYINDKNDDKKFMKLFGRRVDYDRYEYYTTHHKDTDLKIPLPNKGDKELYDGDYVKVPGYISQKHDDHDDDDNDKVKKCSRQVSYGKTKSVKKTCSTCNIKKDPEHNNNFQVHLYDYESPKYLPYLL